MEEISSPFAFNSGKAVARELPNIAQIIGRDQVIAALEAKLATEKLVTVVGPAGVGKTTVAFGHSEPPSQTLSAMVFAS